MAGKVIAPIGAIVRKLNVKKGQKIEAGDIIAVLDVMKTQFEVTSEFSGTVEEIFVNELDEVEAEAPLILIV